MPKAFTASQKDRVKLKLLQKGREYFTRYGLKKTSVDDLVKAVGIAKGSFYTFFESKEALFLAVHEASEEKLRTGLMQKLEVVTAPADKLRVFLKSSFAMLEEDPLMLAIFSRSGLESLPGFISSGQYEEHYRQNITFMVDLIRQWQAEGVIRQVDAEVTGNMIASAFFIFLQKGTLGAEMYTKVTDMLIESMVSYLKAE